MLQSALEQYRQQQRITALGLRQARKVATSGPDAVARAVITYQLASIALSTGSTDAILAEQAITAPPVAQIGSAALLTGTAITALLDSVDSPAAFDRLVASLILDAGRTATAVDIARRPALAGYVRSLNPPSCSRCAILAGRVYRYSTGFLRHPLCDCLMTPTNEAEGADLVTDPTDLLHAGQITGLSKADMTALDAGADLGKVVNIRRHAAGLSVGSSVISRAGKLTPQGVLRIASDRAHAIELLRRYGYLI